MMSNESFIKSNEAAKKARNKPGIIIDNDTAHIFILMGRQSNPQLQLKLENMSNGEFEIDGVKVTYDDNSFIVKDNIYKFTRDFNIFLTNCPNIKNEDIENEEDEKNLNDFYEPSIMIREKVIKEVSRYKRIKQLLDVKRNLSSSSTRYLGRGITKQ